MRVREVGLIHQLVFIYAHGHEILGAGQSGGGRDDSALAYFRHHATHADHVLHVGPAMPDTAEGAWAATLSERVDGAQGGFAGVVMATLAIGDLKARFDEIDVGRLGIISLLSDDNMVLVRSTRSAPGPRPPVGLAVVGRPKPSDPNGSVAYTSLIDGVARVGSFCRLRDYPLSVMVAPTEVEVLENWRAEAQRHLAVCLVVAASLALLGWSLARHMAALRRELRAQAGTDGLTGMSNRRRFGEELAREWRRAARHATPLSLLLLAVDRFKLYSDRYGHLSGDDCLRKVAHTLGQVARRPGDLVARLGGEEFVILLPATEAEGAAAFAEKIRAVIEDLSIAHADMPAGVVTASVGLATFYPSPAPAAAAAQSLTKAADAALHHAKGAGQNRICTSDRAVEPTLPGSVLLPA